MSSLDLQPGTRVVCLTADGTAVYGRGVYSGSPPRPGWNHPDTLAMFRQAVARLDAKPLIDEESIAGWYRGQVAAGKMTQAHMDAVLTRADRMRRLELSRPVDDRVWQMAARSGCNPRIVLDGGETVWGCECWWGELAGASPKRLAALAAMPKAAPPRQWPAPAWHDLTAVTAHPELAHLAVDDGGGMWSSALMSPCRTYRYALTRIWNAQLPPAVFVMLNPSTADARYDDATIRRCIRFAYRWGLGGIMVVNLFALRATNPRELSRHDNPVGPDNTKVVLSVLAGAGSIESAQVVAAWGGSVPTVHHDQITVMKWLLRDAGTHPVCLGHTRHGQPCHPLRLANDTLLQPLHETEKSHETRTEVPGVATPTTAGQG